MTLPPLPRKMRGLPVDRRGLPIPYVVLRDRVGEPVFTVNDTFLVLRVKARKLCGICGTPLQESAWLVGGCQSAFHPDGAYADPPMHHECGTYALQVCPYLALSSYRGKADPVKLSEKCGRVLVDPTIDDQRPAFFVFAKVKEWSFTPRGYVMPVRPFTALEYWIAGRKVALPDARAAFTREGKPWPDYFPALCPTQQ